MRSYFPELIPNGIVAFFETKDRAKIEHKGKYDERTRWELKMKKDLDILKDKII